VPGCGGGGAEGGEAKGGGMGGGGVNVLDHGTALPKVG